MCPSPRVVTGPQCPPECRAWARPSAAGAWGGVGSSSATGLPSEPQCCEWQPRRPSRVFHFEWCRHTFGDKGGSGLCKHRGMDPLPASGSVRNVTTCSQGLFTVTETSLVWSEGSPDLSDNPGFLLDQLYMKWGSVLI